MLELQRLRSDHLAAILQFELENRAYFGGFVTDRGDQFYEQLPEWHRELMAEQSAGRSVFHVLVDEHGEILGRFNLYDLDDGTARVGYRVAERATGRGVATSTVEELCRVAAEEYGLSELDAMTRNDNVASQRVLEKAGFVSVGPTEVAGAPGTSYRRAAERTGRSNPE